MLGKYSIITTVIALKGGNFCVTGCSQFRPPQVPGLSIPPTPAPEVQPEETLLLFFLFFIFETLLLDPPPVACGGNSERHTHSL